MTPMFLAAEHPPVDCSLGRSNRAVAWTGICLGAGSGMIMGLWAFDGPLSPPARFVDYDVSSVWATSRFSASAISICCSLGICRRLDLAREPNK